VGFGDGGGSAHKLIRQIIEITPREEFPAGATGQFRE
jgi:hypothetical protein